MHISTVVARSSILDGLSTLIETLSESKNKQKLLKVRFTYPMIDPDFEFSQDQQLLTYALGYSKLVTSQI